MEHNGYYTSDQQNKHNREDRGGNAFATIVIIIVLVLLALLVTGLFWPNLLGGSMPDYTITDLTPTPQAGTHRCRAR